MSKTNFNRSYEDYVKNYTKWYGITEDEAKMLLEAMGMKPGETMYTDDFDEKSWQLFGQDWGNHTGTYESNLKEWLKTQASNMQSQSEETTNPQESDTIASGKVGSNLETISETADEETANKVAEQIASSEEGQATDAEDAQAKAKAARLSAANAGVGEQRAGLLGSSNDSTNNSAIYSAANRNLQQSTQADYLNKMGQAEAMDLQAKNMRKGTVYNTIAGTLSGAAGGAMAGFVISDETQKEPIDEKSNSIDEDKLREQIAQFKDLYRRVKALRRK